jgi:putative nucleotidyltransferase with HDIG domain
MLQAAEGGIGSSQPVHFRPAKEAPYVSPSRFLLQFAEKRIIYRVALLRPRQAIFKKRNSMKPRINQLFPELEQIEDEELRAKVASTWLEAIEKGEWGITELEKVPFTLLIPECSVNLVDHTRAVTQTALRVAGALLDFYKGKVEIDLDLLIAGGILHDVGKILEYGKEKGKAVKSKTGKLLRHPFSGAALAYKHGLPEEVVHMIATHAKEGDGGYRSTEAMIIHYADFINFESLGGKM